MPRKSMISSGIIILCVAIAAIIVGPLMSRVEQAKYTVAEKHGNIEIRDYAPLIVAQVEVSGNRQEAINQRFRIIADYIFGNNICVPKKENDCTRY